MAKGDDGVAAKGDVDPAKLLQIMQVLQGRAEAAEAAAQRSARNTKVSLIGLLTVSLVSLVGIGVAIARLPMERYIYTDAAKAICEAQTEGAPLLSTNTVMDFAKECMLDMDTMAHDAMEKGLTRTADRCFTPAFRKEFFQAPWLSERIDLVKGGFMRVTAQTTGPVLVESEGATAEGYRWVVQVPVKRTFKQGETVKGANERVYRVSVYRVTTNAYNPVGLGISGFEERTSR